MIEISLEPVPSQSISIVLDGAQYDIRIKQIGAGYIIDISRDNAALINGQRLIGDYRIIDYDHLRSGNFVLSTSEALPDHTEFGASQILYYLTAAEVQSVAT
jgi:hypothetical protein